MLTSDKMYQTILFADIAGSTRLYDKLGDERARLLVAACMDKLAVLTKEKKGTVIKTIGDELMSIFDTPDQAASAAIYMQEQISTDPQMVGEHIQMRIGLHHGSVIRESDDVFGDAVNMAARMVDQAKGGQIITSGHTLKLLERIHQSCARLVDQTRVKGKWTPIDIYELSWGRPEEQTMITTVGGGPQKCQTIQSACMYLTFEGKRVSIGRSCPVVTLGRDTTNTIIINDPKVSRLHARIELRKDDFILIDQSTNGTYILKKDTQTAIVRRGELTLPEIGVIGLGQQAAPDSPLAVHFQIIDGQNEP